jgi:hypothetical protein
MNRRKRYDRIDERARELVRFDRFYARLLREARKAASVIEVNEAQLGIFHELLSGPGTLSWLSGRLDSLTDRGLAAARNLEWFHEERARKLLEELAPRHQQQLVGSMRAIVEILQRDWVANLIERFRKPA